MGTKDKSEQSAEDAKAAEQRAMENALGAGILATVIDTLASRGISFVSQGNAGPITNDNVVQVVAGLVDQLKDTQETERQLRALLKRTL